MELVRVYLNIVLVKYFYGLLDRKKFFFNNLKNSFPNLVVMPILFGEVNYKFPLIHGSYY